MVAGGGEKSPRRAGKSAVEGEEEATVDDAGVVDKERKRAAAEDALSLGMVASAAFVSYLCPPCLRVWCGSSSSRAP